ncbi:MAG: protein kinase [Acidobacteriia bacterium]|nr:protein kinase [Terriglobia bacterium]
MPLSPGASVGPYNIVSMLGAGGMGEVWRARDTRLQRVVALKVLPDAFAADPERLARFEREAQLPASLNHPNIATLHGLEESGGVRALVMELVEGPSLPVPLPLAEALRLARQIADAFEYAHSKGVIHRDLKPANVKLTAEGNVKVLDFGLAKAMSDEQRSADPANSPTLTLRATATGVIMGTAAYMSPEQAKGEDTDKRADVWAFGALLYEMLTGARAFAGDSISETLAAVLLKEPDWSALPAETPAAVRRLLRRCLVRDRRLRLADIGVARMEIDEPLEPIAGAAPVDAALAPPPKQRRVLPWVAGTCLFAILALGLAAVHFREKPPETLPMRFTIAGPGKSHFDHAELSPDGRRLAVVVHPESGVRQIGIRPLDSLEVQLFPGTENSTIAGVMWSPDSRSLIFSSQGKLKRIDPGAGPPVTLADATNNFGMTWGADGAILFFDGTGLQRLPAIGGVPVPVPKSAGQSLPRFLPRGNSYLCLIRDEKLGKIFVSVASLDSGEVTRLVETTAEARFAPLSPESEQGHLLFMRGTTLMAQRFDASRRRLDGDPWPVAESILSLFSMQASYSVSWNGLLSFRTGADGGAGGGGLQVLDREGRKLSSQPAGFASVDLSRDGTRVAFQEGYFGATQADLWQVQLASGVRSRFTFHPAHDSNPVWSPDNSKIVFGSPRDKPGSLFVKISTGAGAEELLFPSDVPIHATDWSPDGSQILFTRMDAKTRTDIWALPLTGDRKPKLWLQSEFAESHGQFSPDGRFVAYQSNETGTYEIYVRPFPNAGSGKWQLSSGGGHQPRWRPDGKELFYMDEARKIMVVEVRGAFEHSTPKPLFDSNALGTAAQSRSNRRTYAVAPDGKRFYVLSGGEDRDTAPVTVLSHWAK